MAGPWISDADLKSALADMLGKTSASLVGKWTDIVTAANVAAANDIAQRLLARGYSAAQIDAWDYRAVFNRDIGLFWALVKGGGLADYSDVGINKLDRRKELDTLAVLIGGAVALPAVDATTGGFAVGGGDFIDTLVADGGRYRFNMNTEF